MGNIHHQLSDLRRQLDEIRMHMTARSGPTPGVFVIGCPRSGTSALSWALAQHPSYWTSSEANFLYTLVGPNAQGRSKLNEAFESAYAVDDGWLRANGVVYSEFAAFIGQGFDQLFRSRSGGRWWVDSSPENLLIADDLAFMFPNASFVLVIRDGRDVVSSMLASGFSEGWAHDFEKACRTWLHYVEEGRCFQRTHPDCVLEVRNETMAEECERIFRFLRVPRHPDPAAFLQTRRVNSSYPVTADGGPVERRKSWESWPDAMTETFLSIAGDAMRELGYLDDDGTDAGREQIPARVAEARDSSAA